MLEFWLTFGPKCIHLYTFLLQTKNDQLHLIQRNGVGVDSWVYQLIDTKRFKTKLTLCNDKTVNCVPHNKTCWIYSAIHSALVCKKC